MSASERAAVKAVKEDMAKPAKYGNLRRVCSGQGPGTI